jgi:hypothetical protein
VTQSQAQSSSSWDATRGWVRKWVETAAALVFSKLVIVVVLVTGINAMGLSGAGGESGGATLSDAFSGLLLLTVATLAPWLCWQFVHWSGAEIAHGMHQSMGRGPIPQAVKRGGRAVTSAAVTGASGLVGGPSSAGSSASASPAVGAPRPPGPGGGSSGGPARCAANTSSGGTP